MLYVDKLDALTQEAEKAVKNLFDKAKKNQSHPNDLLLVLVNGFYDDDLLNSQLKLSPYVIGQGEEGFADHTQYEFFHSFRIQATVPSKEDWLKLEEEIPYLLI